MAKQNKPKNFGIIIFVVAAVISLVIPVIFFNSGSTQAQSTELPFKIGRLEGSGTFFKLDESEYLKITLESSEPIKLSLESVPEIVILQLEPVLDSSSATITLGGFLPNTTYHKYEDSYHNHFVFTTDSEGKYTYTQDLSQPHLVFIQPRPSTKFIKDNATGGDCYLIGNWDISTKTCTLTQDLTETIQIDSNNITLDGNGHTMIGSRTGFGVYLPYRKNVTIKNLTIKNFVVGIYLSSAAGNTITANETSSNAGRGIFLLKSSSNTVSDNFSSRNFYFGEGISLCGSNNNIIKNNNSSKNSFFGIYLEESSNNNITDNTFDYHYSAGAYVSFLSNNNIFTFNTLSRSNYGIFVTSSNNNKIYNNNFVNNKEQAIVYSSTGNIFNLPLPDGGNYWSDFDTPEDGCNDLNNDNICDFPYVFIGGQDNFPWIKKDGWLGQQNQPPQVSNLGQFKSDGITEISEGGITTENTVVFKAVVSDPDNDQVKLQIEVKEFGQAFDGNNLLESDFVASGSEVVLSKNNLSDAKYHWRARAVDNQGGTSDWQEFGTIGNVDFEVKTVPLYTQVFSPYPSEEETRSWFNEPYAQGIKYSCGSKIYQCGCAITSMVMLGRYYKIDTAIDNTNVDPRNINSWLKSNNGYTKDGRLYWGKAIEYLGFIENGIKKVRLSLDYFNEPFGSSQIINYINAAKPAVAYSDRFGHYFVADNKLATTYNIKDPFWYNTKTLNDTENLANKIRGYNNFFDKANLFSYLETPRKISASLYLSLASPAELLITDPQGRKLGRDPIKNINYSEIPNSIYTEEGPIVTSDDPLEPSQIHKTKVIYIPTPINGNYDLRVIGTDNGDYTLASLFYDDQGNSQSREIESKITAGQIVQYNIFFDPLDVNNNHIEIIEEMKSFDVKKMTIFWGFDCPELEEEIEEIEDLEKEMPKLEKKLPKHCLRKKNTFTLWGNFKLPGNYQKDDLDKVVVLDLKFGDKQAKDKVSLKEQNNLWLYQEKFHQDDSLGQGIDIKTAIIHWSLEKELCKKWNWVCQKKDQNENWFYIRGELSLDGVDIGTQPRQAEVSIEIPLTSNEIEGYIFGKDIVEFKKLKHLWFYFEPPFRKFWDIFGLLRRVIK